MKKTRQARQEVSDPVAHQNALVEDIPLAVLVDPPSWGQNDTPTAQCQIGRLHDLLRTKAHQLTRTRKKIPLEASAVSSWRIQELYSFPQEFERIYSGNQASSITC